MPSETECGKNVFCSGHFWIYIFPLMCIIFSGVLCDKLLFSHNWISFTFLPQFGLKEKYILYKRIWGFYPGIIVIFFIFIWGGEGFGEGVGGSAYIWTHLNSEHWIIIWLCLITLDNTLPYFTSWLLSPLSTCNIKYLLARFFKMISNYMDSQQVKFNQIWH